MTDSRIRDVVIVGGGTAGWMAAAALSAIMGDQLRIRLVESDEIGTVGVGEATIPAIRLFNGLVGIDENAFIKATQGSFKLGIQFVDWARKGHTYFHPFGGYGVNMAGVSFHAFFLRLHAAGEAPDIDAFSLQATAARADKFMRPIDAGNSPLSDIAYAYHDITLVHMVGNAHAHRFETPQNSALDITSEKLIVHPEEDIIETDQPAVVIQGDSRLIGDGMKYNNNTRKLDVYANSGVRIAPKDMPSSNNTSD